MNLKGRREFYVVNSIWWQHLANIDKVVLQVTYIGTPAPFTVQPSGLKITATPQCLKSSSYVGTRVKVKGSAQACKAHQAALISDSSSLSQTPAKAARPRTRSQCVAWFACLSPTFHRYRILLPGDRSNRRGRNLPIGSRTRDDVNERLTLVTPPPRHVTD